MSTSTTDSLTNPAPRIEWRDEIPYSLDYHDTYFSTQGGTAESEHVFIAANNLSKRWAQLTNTTFVIAELGFGFGLNFLCSWKLWHSINPRNCQLHYIACENAPLKSADLARMLENVHNSDLDNFSSALLKSYQNHSRGFHRLSLQSKDGHSQVTLDLYYADASDALSELVHECTNKIDAWFLDGFSPKNNPALWDDTLFSTLARLSSHHTTLSSYSVAGNVRRALARHHFQVKKVIGFGAKRNMLTATFNRVEKHIESDREQQFKPWFRLSRSRHKNKKAIIIGAGLAGSSTAYALARRGYEVTVIEKESAPARGASGNPQAVLHCQLQKKISHAARFQLQSYIFSHRQFESFDDSIKSQLGWSNCGVFSPRKSMRPDTQSLRWQPWSQYSTDIVHSLSKARALERTGWKNEFGGDFYPLGGWLDPASLCAYYLSNQRISVIYSSAVETLQNEDGRWQVCSNNGEKVIASAEIVIVANSFQANELTQLANLPLTPVRGQVSHLRKLHGDATTTVICADSYIVPEFRGEFSIGSTYELHSRNTQLLAQDQRSNVTRLMALAPHLHERDLEITGGRASIRCATPDYLPLVGAVPDFRKFLETYKQLGRNARQQTSKKGPCHSGLYINAGHGSHGLASCPLAGEVITSMICNEPMPLQREVLHCINPARFLIKEIKRQKYR